MSSPNAEPQFTEFARFKKGHQHSRLDETDDAAYAESASISSTAEFSFQKEFRAKWEDSAFEVIAGQEDLRNKLIQQIKDEFIPINAEEATKKSRLIAKVLNWPSTTPFSSPRSSPLLPKFDQEKDLGAGFILEDDSGATLPDQNQTRASAAKRM